MQYSLASHHLKRVGVCMLAIITRDLISSQTLLLLSLFFPLAMLLLKQTLLLHILQHNLLLCLLSI